MGLHNIRLEQPNKKPFKRFFPETNKKQFLPEMIRVRLFHHVTCNDVSVIKSKYPGIESYLVFICCLNVHIPACRKW